MAYQEFLRQNGLSDEVVEEAEYNGVLEAQKILGEDLSLLADENSAKEVSDIESALSLRTVLTNTAVYDYAEKADLSKGC